MKSNGIILESTYVCTYDFYLQSGYCEVESTEGIRAFKDGFWINSDLKLTKGMDSKYWIPPSQIKLITKMKNKGDNFGNIT